MVRSRWLSTGGGEPLPNPTRPAGAPTGKYIHRACPGVLKAAQPYNLRSQPNHPRDKPGGFPTAPAPSPFAKFV
jgi:hypothetical protein